MAGVHSGTVQDARRWWTKSAKEAADGISATLTIMAQRQRSRVASLVTHARLYGNLSVWGVTGFTHQQLRLAVQQPVPNRITHNICQMAVDTVTAKVAKNKPKPWFQTSKGDFSTMRKAKKLNDFETGIFYEQKAYEIGVEAFRRCGIWGDSFVFVGDRNERIYSEPVTPSEIYVDEWEGMRGHPRQLHRVMLVDRSVLADAFPGAKDAIMGANPAEAVASTYYPSVSDLVEVRQSWHLRSGPEASDGKTVVTIQGGSQGQSAALTKMQDWPHDYFPFARMSWSPKPIGFWAQGLVEQLEGIQLELNKLLRLCQRSHDLGGSFKMLIPNGSKVVSEHLRAEIGCEVHYSGVKPPEYILPPHVPPEVYQEIRALEDRALRQAGVSMMSAAAQKPEGVDSGKALRTLDNIESDRFSTIAERWENFFCGSATGQTPFPPLGALYIETAKRISEENGGHYKVKVPGRKFLEEVDWKDIDLDADEYQMQCFPISALSQEPAERMQDVQELAQAGIVPQENIAELLDFPDLAKFETLAGAQKDFITEQLEKILDGDGDDEHYSPPDPLINPQLAQKLASQYYAAASLKGLGEPQLKQIRKYMAQADWLIQRSIPPPPPMPPGGPGAPGNGATPQGMPSRPPVSPLMPQQAS